MCYLHGTPRDGQCYVKLYNLAEYEMKIKLRSFKSSEHINEEGDEPCRGFGYDTEASLVTLSIWKQRNKENYCNSALLYKDYNNPNGAKYIK